MYVLTDPDQVEAVQSVLAATANPQHPNEVTVSRPSDALAAKKAVDETLQALLLGLGGVALLVGGIGIANMMVVAVLERRTEIGVRRALGATKRHIRLQFLVEAVLLALLGGVLGVLLGVGRDRRVHVGAPHRAVGAGDDGWPPAWAPRSSSARWPACRRRPARPASTRPTRSARLHPRRLRSSRPAPSSAQLRGWQDARTRERGRVHRLRGGG